MSDFSQTCIFDGSSDDLNTIMEVTYEGEKYKIAVCDGCEDDASLGAIKKRIPNKIKELEEKDAELDKLRDAAAALGFDLVKAGMGELMIPVASESDPPAIQPQPSPQPQTLDDAPIVNVGTGTLKVQKNTRAQKESSDMGAEEASAAIEAAKRAGAANRSLESPKVGEAPAYRSHTTEPVRVQTRNGEQVYQKPEVYQKEIQTVRGRAGVPTAIPKSISGAAGKTTIKIVDTGGDKTIQNRAKQLAGMREYGDETFYSHQCRPCQGRGFHDSNKSCRTCGGTGIII
jgi:hypothetical protein